MPRTIEALIDENNCIRLLENIRVEGLRRALLVILEEDPVPIVSEAALLAEPALAVDWNRPEEDAAWAHLNPAK